MFAIKTKKKHLLTRTALLCTAGTATTYSAGLKATVVQNSQGDNNPCKAAHTRFVRSYKKCICDNIPWRKN